MSSETFQHLKPNKKQHFKQSVYRLFASTPYEDIGIRDITRAAGIALGSFYRYFNDKDEMYLELFQEIEQKLFDDNMSDLDSSWVSKPRSRYDKVLSEEEIRFGESFYTVPDTVLYKYYFNGYMDRIYEAYEGIFADLEAQGALKEGVDRHFALFYFKTAFFNFIMFLKRQGITDPEEIFKRKRLIYEQVVLPAIIKPEPLQQLLNSKMGGLI